MPSLIIERTAHYEILMPQGKPKGIWLCLHGYGQLAKRFARRLKPLQDEGYIVLAPEGLNRFYWEGYSGKMAANWMTSHHRLDEIKDYVNYLDQLYDKFHGEYPDRDMYWKGQSSSTIIENAVSKLTLAVLAAPRFSRIRTAGLLCTPITHAPL